MAERFPFTKSAIEAIHAPARGRATYLDSKVPGLQLRVTANGIKTFSLYRRVRGGSPERVTLGRFPSLTVENARAQAGKINNAIDAGANPAETKRAHRAEVTFAELFADYVTLHSKPNKRTWEEDEAKYKRYLASPLGGKRVSAIERLDLGAIHGAITKAGHGVTANRVLALASSVFGWAKDTGRIESNPAEGIRKNPERSRDRFLQTNEVPRFFKALAEETNATIRDYFLVSLLTGARRANVLAMKWQEIDFERAEWRIPRTKNHDPQVVPLSAEAVAVLQGRRPEQATAGFVFPGGGEGGHLVEPKLGWRRIFDRDELVQLTERIAAAGGSFVPLEGESLGMSLARAREAAAKLKVDTTMARMADLRIHDLRRTLGSWQARTGASLSIIGKSLNHKSVQTTAIYARLDTDPVRESVERATSAMLAAAGVKPKGEVKQMKKARKR